MAVSVRSFWKGYLRLALVAIPIRLVSAEKAEAMPKFHQIDRETGQRIHYLKVVPGKGEVAKEDIVMGYEVEPGHYVLMEDEELESVRLDSRHTIELTQFVDVAEIDPLYFVRPYYLLPDGDVAEEGYGVIREALKASRKAAIGQLTLRGKENLVAIYPGGDGLVLDTLRYESEIKDIDEVFSGMGSGRASADMLKMAEQLIESRSASFDPDRFKNHYAEALRDLVQSKLTTGKTLQIGETGKGAKVIDFMEALKRSVAGERDSEAPKASKEPAPREKSRAKAEPAPARPKRAAARTAAPSAQPRKRRG